MINLTDLADEFSAPAAASHPTAASKFQSALSRFYNAWVRTQEAKASRVVRRYLGQHDDAQLMRMGFSGDQIKSLRSTNLGPVTNH